MYSQKSTFTRAVRAIQCISSIAALILIILLMCAIVDVAMAGPYRSHQCRYRDGSEWIENSLWYIVAWFIFRMDHPVESYFVFPFSRFIEMLGMTITQHFYVWLALYLLNTPLCFYVVFVGCALELIQVKVQHKLFLIVVRFMISTHPSAPRLATICSQDENCGICLSPFKETCHQTIWGHFNGKVWRTFHADCLIAWQTASGKLGVCPLTQRIETWYTIND